MSDLEARDAACHELLLALAGRLPDDTVRAARRALANGEVRSAAATALDALAGHGVAVTSDELAATAELAADPSRFQQLGGFDAFLTVDQSPSLAYEFITEGPGGGTAPDQVDDVVVMAAETYTDQVKGVWRCWRQSVSGEPADSQADDPQQTDPQAATRRVYLVQTDQAEAAPALAGTFYDMLESVGETEAGVEVVHLGAEPAGYQRLALDAALLLWAESSSAGPEFQVARIYDQVDPVTGPGFAPEHPRIEDLTQRARLLEYLAAGRPVLSTTARMPDPLEPEAGEVVPLGFQTDGEWIWTEAVGYFLDRHGIAPDPELVAHIRYADYTAPYPDNETVSRASAFLLQPPPEDSASVIWTPERR